MEVLDNKIEERWFVRTQSASPEAGWVPPTVLMPIGKEETDGKSSRAKITSGEPVSPSRVRGGLTTLLVRLFSLFNEVGHSAMWFEKV